MKALVLALSAYLKEHHLSGLAWNPHGKDFAEAKVGEGGSAKKPAPVATSASAPSAGGGAGGVFAELTKKKTDDGSSAATGLKKVTREQQTWRKEYKKDDVGAPAEPVAPAKPATASKFGAKKPSGPPKCEYQERGFKWIIENQTKETCEGGVCKVTITDAKQQVYIYNCETLRFKSPASSNPSF
jgi:adenylyl cyclase-associated protein